MELHNAQKTCWNCPAAKFEGYVDFRACGQTKEELKKKIEKDPDYQLVIECRRRPELGAFEPTITFEDCPQWIETEYGYMLKDMRVMILGIDGYLGWSLALKLAKLGCMVSGVDNFLRRECVLEKGSHSIIPIADFKERLHFAQKYHNISLNFRQLDINDINRFKEFLEEVKPEAIVHYAEIPSAPYSMVDLYHAAKVQENNVIGTLKLLFLIKEIVPETSLVKLGTMGEYGAPLTGRPIFEGMFPADAILKWDNREWSLGGELTPRNPGSFYHVSKVQDTYNVYEACRYWWLKSYDIMQGVIFGVHTEETAVHDKMRTRFDIDEWFGTAVNRFVAQAIAGIPLTIYGAGEQIRGFIGLEDAMQCMIRLIFTPPEPGQYDVVNQISGIYKISDLAEMVAQIGSRDFGLEITIQRLENPRVEPDRHPFEVVARKLPQEFHFQPKVSLEEEIYRMFELLTRPEFKERILEKRKIILPLTTWHGEKRQMQTLEVYKPGGKRSTDPDIKLKQKIIVE